ncbi:hypothetical protein H257_13769 [Aphanomyces astaci]|uniref:Uncharacterized protein n=1 Tax=Aphanomyces astaci TaxID=112090 RepID=W4FT72_APHAT|nr:hypothetical protein H257_13769 [Aphanomyces astaci]ETV70657.1 hypothetical protein H257_13769 [Aphanomyces astaci]|eukprot:XP_009839721.1 hypothetical protein H257_13769 [Aphanomyces astaci]
MATESLKGASFRKKLVTRFKPKESDAIPLARALRACHGQDIKKKSGHRKGKFLFAFPGLVSPMPEGGTLGTLDKLDTDKPVLYIDFPQGRLKMQGTLVYAQNRFLTLQCARRGKSVVCDDVFDAVVTFPEVSWIGPVDANPSEAPLPIPSFLHAYTNIPPSYTFGAGDYNAVEEAANEADEQPPPPRTTPERRSKTACLLAYSSALATALDDQSDHSDGEFSPLDDLDDGDEMWQQAQTKRRRRNDARRAQLKNQKSKPTTGHPRILPPTTTLPPSTSAAVATMTDDTFAFE